MMSSTLTRRELAIWTGALALAIVAFVQLRPGAAGAGALPTATTQVAYIATGANFPDALAAASPAALGLGPVLLVQQDAIPQPTLDELNRLEPRHIIVVGGTGVISQGVEDAIGLLPFSPVVTRIAGADRYATAAELSLATFPTSGKYPRVAYEVSTDIVGGSGGVPFDALDVAIHAPDVGYLVINASADTAFTTGNPAIVGCWIWLDAVGNVLPGSQMFVDLDSTVTEQNCITNAVVEVHPGQHVVALRMSQDDDINVYHGTLSVMWIPFGNYGQLATPPS